MKKTWKERASVSQAPLVNAAVKQVPMVLPKGEARKPKGLSRDQKLPETHNFYFINMADSSSKAFL